MGGYALTQEDNWCSLCELYVLGGLESDEKRSFEEHLSDCKECQDRVRDIEGLSDQLLVYYQEVEVPEGMRSRVLQHVFANDETAPIKDVQTTPIFHHQLRSRNRFRISTWPSVAAVAVIALLVVGISQIHDRTVVPSSPLGTVMQSEALSPTAVMNQASAKLWITGSATTAKDLYMKFSGLAPVVGSQVYQVWLVEPTKSGASIYSCGIFKPNSKGEAIFASKIPHSHYSVIAVTLEPRSTDVTPLGPKVLVGAVNV